jgi:acyl-CoA thioester hydrolase
MGKRFVCMGAHAASCGPRRDPARRGHFDPRGANAIDDRANLVGDRAHALERFFSTAVARRSYGRTMPFSHTIRPRYAEVDMQRVVFNAHWLTYFDDTSTRFFESLGFDPRETFLRRGVFDAMVVKAVLEWKGAASFDDEISIAARAERLGTKSFDLKFDATVEGREACSALITYVCVTPGTKESCVIPALLRERLEPTLP